MNASVEIFEIYGSLIFLFTVIYNIFVKKFIILYKKIKAEERREKMMLSLVRLKYDLRF